jgi:hypothetical protein
MRLRVAAGLSAFSSDPDTLSAASLASIGQRRPRRKRLEGGVYSPNHKGGPPTPASRARDAARKRVARLHEHLRRFSEDRWGLRLDGYRVPPEALTLAQEENHDELHRRWDWIDAGRLAALRVWVREKMPPPVLWSDGAPGCRQACFWEVTTTPAQLRWVGPRLRTTRSTEGCKRLWFGLRLHAAA